jgi:hypothetical protein
MPPKSEPDARSLRLLQDPEVGLGDRQARRLASTIPFELLFAQVLTWRRELRAGRVNSPGAIVSRCDQQRQPDPLPQDYTGDPLYLRAAGLSVGEARRQRYVPAEYEDVVQH